MRRLLPLLVGVLMSLHLQAQNVELGLFLGTSHYLGDLQSKLFGGTENHIAYGLFGRYHVKEYLSVRANVYRGKISGNDALQSNNKLRNFSFRSDITELGLVASFNPML